MNKLTKDQVEEIKHQIEESVSSGNMYPFVAEILENILNEAINYTHCCAEFKTGKECYKSGEPCEYDCSGLCKESC